MLIVQGTPSENGHRNRPAQQHLSPHNLPGVNWELPIAER